MTIETIKDKLAEALQSDLEHGVKWLNEQASKEFTSKYPQLVGVIEYIMKLD